MSLVLERAFAYFTFCPFGNYYGCYWCCDSWVKLIIRYNRFWSLWSDRHCKLQSTIKIEVRNISRSFEGRKEGRRHPWKELQLWWSSTCDKWYSFNRRHQMAFLIIQIESEGLIYLNQVHLTSQVPSTTSCHGNWQVLLLCPWDGTTVIGWLLRKHWTFSKVINKVIIILPATYWIFWKIG
jgi:hypothetical protein